MTHVGQLSRRTSDTSSWGIRGPTGSRHAGLARAALTQSQRLLAGPSTRTRRILRILRPSSSMVVGPHAVPRTLGTAGALRAPVPSAPWPRTFGPLQTFGLSGRRIRRILRSCPSPFGTGSPTTLPRFPRVASSRVPPPWRIARSSALPCPTASAFGTGRLQGLAAAASEAMGAIAVRAPYCHAPMAPPRATLSVSTSSRPYGPDGWIPRRSYNRL